MEAKVGTFTGAGASGNQTVSIGESWTPVAVILCTVDNGGGFSDEHRFMVGAATGSSERWCAYIVDGDNQSPPVAFETYRDNKVLDIYGGGNADFVSFGAGEFTINWDASSGGGTIGYIVFGNCEAQAGTITATDATDWQQVTVTTGFEIVGLFALGQEETGTDDADIQSSLGFADAASVDTPGHAGAIGWSSLGSGGQSETHVADGDFLCYIPLLVSSGIAAGAFIDAITATDFTLETTFDFSNSRIGYLALGGEDNDTRANVEDSPASPGLQTLTAGFLPAAVMFSLGPEGEGEREDSRACLGATDGVNSWVFSVGSEDSTNPTNTARRLNTTQCVAAIEAASTVLATAEFDSFIGTGAIIDWTDVDSVVKRLAWWAVGPASVEFRGQIIRYNRSR